MIYEKRKDFGVLYYDLGINHYEEIYFVFIIIIIIIMTNEYHHIIELWKLNKLKQQIIEFMTTILYTNYFGLLPRITTKKTSNGCHHGTPDPSTFP